MDSHISNSTQPRPSGLTASRSSSGGGDELYVEGVVDVASVLDQIHSQYIDGEGIDSVRCNALLLAAFAFDREDIDKNLAKKMTHWIAKLAASMLLEEGATEWDPLTQVALQKIRGSDRDVARMYAPKLPF